MPSKSAEHIAYTRLTDKHIEIYLKNRSFTIKACDHNNEKNHVIKLHYKAKKNLSKLNRNLNSMKGTRITPHDLDDMQIHDGNGFFDSVKGIMNNKITKGIVKAAAPEIGNILGNQISNLTGSQLAGNMTKSLIKEGAKEAVGQGFNFKSIMNNKITKGIVKAAAPEVANILGNQITSLTGSNLAGNMTKSLIKEGAKEATGQGIKYIRSGGSFAALNGGSIKSKSGGNVQLKSAVENQQFLGIGHNAPDFSNPHQERMRHVRSFRKTK